MATQHMLNFTNNGCSYDIEFEIQILVDTEGDVFDMDNSSVIANITRVWVDGNLTADVDTREYCNTLVNDWLYSEDTA